MNIGIIIGRIGDVDGVALETEKWIQVLEKMGHTIYILSGRFKREIIKSEQQTVFRPLSFFSPECEWEQNRAFFFPDEDPSELLSHLEITTELMASRIFKWIMHSKIDVIVSENASALPCHLSMGLAIKKVAENTGLNMVCHDHDFYWERGDRYESPHKEIMDLVEETFPLRLPNVHRAVINIYSRDLIMKRFNADSMVVPNVMDFNKPFARKDEYNRELLSDLGIKNGDLPLFQITRIVKRKGIETAIDLVNRLDDKNIRLIITGSTADDSRKGYYKELIDQIASLRLKSRVIFAYKKILSERGTTYRGRKIYSLSDAYAHTTACTYFSTYEGFGNAFVECILAKRPIFVNNYKPVYWPDIGSKGFKTVMLEDSKLTDKKISEIDTIIHNQKTQKEIVEHNFELGKKLFSYEVLEKKLEALFSF